MRAVVILTVAAGCRQIFGLDDPTLVADGTDAAAVIDTRLPDTTMSSGTCIERWQAGPAIHNPVAIVSVNTSAAELDPFVTADGLELYLSRAGDIHIATRVTTTAAFGAPVAVPSLNSNAADEKVSISPNRLRAFFSSARGGGSGGYDLWRASRNDVAAAWSVDQSYLVNVNDGSGQSDPSLSPDLLSLYFAPAVITQHISFSSRTSLIDTFSTPTTIPELMSTGQENDPTISSDELVIVFQSTRSGNNDLWYATRTSKTAAFGTPKPVTPLNTTSFESSPHLSGDGCELYFASNRGGNDDIYVSLLQ